MKTLKTVGLSLLLCSVLAACSSAPANNSLSVNFKEGRFDGKAGADWSDAELRSNAFGALCGTGGTVAQIDITRAPDGASTFSGTCA